MVRASKGFKWMLACLLPVLTLPVLAQETVLVTSQTATGTGGESTYSVGQVAFRTIESATGTVTQGVQQPYEILFMTGLDGEQSISLTCHVFPNPATSEVRLKIDRPSFESLTYKLTDLNGVVLRESIIVEDETVLPVHDLPANVYILTLFEHNNNLLTWKVLKK